MTTSSLAAPGVERARVAVAVAFAVNGVAFASWVSRTPAVRDALELSSTQLGMLLLCLSGGAVVALPSAGALVHRVGPARAVVAGAVLVSAGLVGVAGGVAATTVAVAALGLLLIGFGSATWDVAMNVEGADVERRLGRSLMPRLHAAFSLGTVSGALLGAACAAGEIGVPAQLLATALLSLGSVAVATRSFVKPDETELEHRHTKARVVDAWKEPRTLLVGVMVLAFAFTEGTANDWLAIAMVDGHGTSDAVGALGFGLFVSAMTVSRLVGGAALESLGRVPVLRGTAAVAAVGLLVVALGPSPAWAAAGALLWGAGAALGFPVGMSAAADEPARAAVRVSVVSSIGYTAFLAGPPLLGSLADRVGILHALLVVLALLLVGLATAGAAREPAAG